MEIVIEKDDENTAEIFLIFTKLIKLFIHNIQYLYIKYIDFIDVQ